MGILSSLSEGDFEHPGLPQGVMIDSACETGDTAVMAVFPKFKCIALCGIVREADPVRGLKRVEVRSGAVVVVDAVRNGTFSARHNVACSTPFLHMIQYPGKSRSVRKTPSGSPLDIFDPTSVNAMNPVLAFPGMGSIQTEEQFREIVLLQSRPSNNCSWIGAILDFMVAFWRSG